MTGRHPCRGHSAQRASVVGIAGWGPTLAGSWGTIFGTEMSVIVGVMIFSLESILTAPVFNPTMLGKAYTLWSWESAQWASVLWVT